MLPETSTVADEAREYGAPSTVMAGAPAMSVWVPIIYCEAEFAVYVVTPNCDCRNEVRDTGGEGYSIASGNKSSGRWSKRIEDAVDGMSRTAWEECLRIDDKTGYGIRHWY